MPKQDLTVARRLGAAAILALLASPAHAYMGAGAGLSALGSILSFLGVFVLMAVGFLWYPIKRTFKRLRGKSESQSETQAQQ